MPICFLHKTQPFYETRAILEYAEENQERDEQTGAHREDPGEKRPGPSRRRKEVNFCVNWRSGRAKAIAQLQEQVRDNGTFVDRAIVREIKIASERFAEKHSAWIEVMDLADGWERGRPDLRILEAIRQINRSANSWRAQAPIDPLGA